MTSPQKIRFFFDTISSNAYLAWVELPKLAARYGAEIEPVPVLFAALLEAHGQLGPAEIRPKALWMLKDNLRKAALLGVPLNPPAHHPFNPLLALRASGVPKDEAQRNALITGLFEAVWVHGQHVSEAGVVEQVGNAAGLDGARLVAEAQTPESKARLREQTEDAIASGVFSVPTMIVGDELFWGYDDFPHLELLLAGKDPLAAREREKWQRSTPTPSSVRRRMRPPGAGA